MADILSFLGDVAFPTAMERMRQRQAATQAQQIIGQPGQEYQPGAGQGMLQNIQGTGLLGGQISPVQAGTQMLGVPGYEQVGLNLLNQFSPKPQGPMEYKTIELGAGGDMKQQFAYNPANPQQLIPMGQPYKFGSGGAEDKTLGQNAPTWLNAAGQPASPLLTQAQAVSQGYTPRTTEQMKAIEASKEFSPILGKSFEYAFGKQDKQGQYQDSLFPSGPIESMIGVRGLTGLLAAGGAATGMDERASLYNKSKAAMVSNLSRLTGQIGTLTDMDVARVEQLLPKAGFTPLPQAKEQFTMIVDLLRSKGLSDEVIKKSGIPDWAFSGSKQQAGNIIDFSQLAR